MRILVTGSEGFIGKNLVAALRRKPECEVVGFDLGDDPDSLPALVAKADAVAHLAGSNRPKDPAEFSRVNRGLTERLVEAMEATGRAVPVAFSSSRQAALDNEYGRSKREAEEVLRGYAERTGASVAVFRFDNVFGKWSRPSYNSVVATFCHAAARGLPLQVNDPAASVRFVYVDDVVEALARVLLDPPAGFSTLVAEPVFERTVGELAETLERYAEWRKAGMLPDFGDPFEKRLWSTFLSFVEPSGLPVARETRADERGWLFEFVKSERAGQIFVSTTRPGATRGNHWHDTKVEKFCLVSGKARISLRRVWSTERVDFDVDDAAIRVVDIPPGWTHSIVNTGDRDCVVLFWANEVFDPARPDTYFLEV